MLKCPKCGSHNTKELKAMAGVRRELCIDCGFQINLDKKQDDK